MKIIAYYYKKSTSAIVPSLLYRNDEVSNDIFTVFRKFKAYMARKASLYLADPEGGLLIRMM